LTSNIYRPLIKLISKENQSDSSESSLDYSESVSGRENGYNDEHHHLSPSIDHGPIRLST